MDNFKNFAKVTVSIGYDASATSIVLSGGHGARLPAAPFNATWWNSTDFADPTDDPNVEIVRVTAIATDTLTVTRGQESITATTKNTASKTYKMIAGLTAKTLNTDLGSGAPIVANGRLTLESGTPVTLDSDDPTGKPGPGAPRVDMVDKTTIYYTPYQGNRISLYDGTSWALHTFSELTLPLGTLTAGANYDVFVYSNAGALTLELGAAWASATARTDAITLQNGVYVKSGATTRRYLGTFRTTSTTTTEDSISKRFVWNYYNRATRVLYLVTGATHTYSGVARMWNNDPLNAIAFVTGLAEDAFNVTVLGNNQVTGTAITAAALDGLDQYRTAYVYGQSPINGGLSAIAPVDPQIGYHVLNLVESATGGAATFNAGYLTAVLFA